MVTGTSMRAAAITEHGPASVLREMSLLRPTPDPGEVLVRVRVAGVQLTDAAIRGGWVPPGARIEFPQILGNEFAGTVVAIGDSVVDVAGVGRDVLGFASTHSIDAAEHCRSCGKGHG